MAKKKGKPAAKKSRSVQAKAAPRKTNSKSGGANGHDIQRPDLLREIEQFLYRQAECLDGKRWDDFIDLFTADGTYWMPASPEQTTGDGVPSIFWEDRDLMNVRLRRLGHPRAWSQKTAWGTNHVVGNVTIEKQSAGEIVVRSRFHMMEFRNDTNRHFAGSYIHHLQRTKNGLRIRLQRVDMVNAQGPYDYVLQAWV